MDREVNADHMRNKNSMIKWEKERKEQRKKRQVPTALIGLVLISSATYFNCITLNQFSISKSTMVNVQNKKKKRRHTSRKKTASHKQPKTETVANTIFY
jgi:hypothetical protein